MIGRRSIRARVLSAVLLVLAVTGLIAGVLIDRSYVSRMNSVVDGNLNSSMSAGQSAATTTATPQAVLSAVRRGEVHGLLNLGTTTQGDPPPAKDFRSVTKPLDATGKLAGAMLTVWQTNDATNAGRRSLDRTLGIVGLIDLIAAGLAMILVIDIALKPLSVMAERATRIANGERGIRMAAPTDATEVGQTASAVDAMLDELEGAERRARAAEAAAKGSADQMKAFLSDAAHELKTPLAGIQAAAESLVQLPDDAYEEREHLAFLLAREAGRGGHLVTSLLESARVDAGVDLRKEPTPLGQVAANEVRRMSLAYPSVDVRVEGRDLTVMADREAITSVLRNIVENAGRAAAPDGWVVIGLGRRAGVDGAPDMAVVTIVDSNGGIPVADRERVFQRLVRLASTATTSKGSGLGLAIARGYARAHGGDIEIVDEPTVPIPLGPDGSARTHGAVFEVTLPIDS